jgi:2-haloacid dehalogenase
MGDKLEGIKACIFDAYGTLFDVHAPMAALAPRIGPAAAELSRLWRQKQLEYTWLRSLMGRHADFWQVTGEALDYALEAHGLADATLRAELMRLYRALDAYPDAREALAELKRMGLVTGILSNGSPDMLASAIASAGLAGALDHVLSIEEAGIYKPHPSVYALVGAHTGLQPRAVCFVSANPWDAQGGAAFGFQVVRVDRLGLKDDRIPGRPVAKIATLAALPALLA